MRVFKIKIKNSFYLSSVKDLSILNKNGAVVAVIVW